MANQLYKGDKPLATFAPQIADNLTTDDSTKALSAKQGKVLKDTKAEIVNYPNLNITNSIGGTETNKANLIGCVGGTKGIGICTFIYKCQNNTTEELTIDLPSGWTFAYGAYGIRDRANGQLVTVWANNNRVSTYLHIGTMTVGNTYGVSIPCIKE